MQNSINKAMLLCAGEGTRLRPLTEQTPKPLLPIGSIPIIVHQLKWLRSFGVTEAGINLYHMGEKIKNELGDGTQYGMKFYYSEEETLMGTAGGLKRLESVFDDTFYVVYGDIFTDFDLGEMFELHKNRNSFLTMALFEAENTSEVGILEVDDKNRVLSFVEKPPKGTELSNLSNGGIYICEPGIFKYIPEGKFYDFGYNVFPQLIKEKLPLFGYKIKPTDYLIDIGTLDKYRQAERDWQAGKIKFTKGPENV